MRLFLNSTNLDEIKEISAWGVLAGVTTNPSLLPEMRGDFVANLRRICSLVEGRVFAQVVSERAEAMVAEGRALAALDDKIVVKVHASAEGLHAIRQLRQHKVEVCATAIHSRSEAMLAAEAGADHAAIFVGLLGQVDEDSTNDLLDDVVQIYRSQGYDTKTLAAARTVNQVVHAARLGVEEMTCPYSTWKQLLDNPHTVNRWKSFLSSWRNAYGEQNWCTGYRGQ